MKKYLFILIVFSFLVCSVAADTLIIYPSVDGYVEESTNANFSTMRSAAGDSASASGTSIIAAPWMETATNPTTGEWELIDKAVISFNTTYVVLQTGTISAAKLSVVGNAKTNGFGGWTVPNFTVTGGTLASNTSLAAGDYDGSYNTILTGNVRYSDYNNAGRQNWSFNSDGLSYISGNSTGYTVLYIRIDDEINNAFTRAYVNDTYDSIQFRPSEYGGATTDPYLELTYTTSTPPVASFTSYAGSSGYSGYPYYYAGFADTSTNNPQSWKWNRTDVTGDNIPITFSTLQNPPTLPLGSGNWSITLTATNSGGSNTTTPYFINLSPQVDSTYYKYIFKTTGTEDGELHYHNTTFTNLRSGLGSDAYTTYANSGTGIVSLASTYDYMNRVYREFNTSALPDSCNIVNATTGTFGDATTRTTLGNWSAGITGFFPATNGTAVAGDYDAFNDIKYSDSYINDSAWSMTSWNNWTLNEAGVTNISKTHYTNYMIRTWWDIENNSTGLNSPGTGLLSYIYTRDAEHSGGANDPEDPYLLVYYTMDSGSDTTPPPSITNLANTTTCNSINWTWENSTVSTDFNHTYILKNNVFDINATNTTHSRLWESLSENTAYTFSSKTVDITGNMNATWVNNTSTTKTSVTASFDKNATDGLYDFGLQVNDTSTGTTLTSWNWSWGDGTWTNTTDSASRNATKTYSTGGNYTIFLLAANSCGSDQSDNQYVDVWNHTQSGFSANVTGGFYNLPVLFTVNTTADNATLWNWSFGDGTWQNGTTQNGTHTYLTGGLYTVTEIASNDHDSDTTTRTDYIDVWNYTTVDFSANVTSGNAPLGVGFTDSSTNATSWYWEFGDGNVSADQNPSNLYNASGIYSVNHSASNAHHTSWENKSAYITVYNATPVADFTSEPPTEGNAPLTVQFYNASTGNGIIGWNWTFGDGGTSSAESPSHQYTVPGTYDVNLTVWNDGGSDDEMKTGYVIVHNATPIADFTVNTTGGCVPTTVQFTDTSTGNNLSWSWKLNGVEFATTRNATYTFTAPGLYEWLNLTVTNDGGSDTESWQDVFYFVDCAPDPITGLTNDTSTCEQLTFDWTNPTNTNFNHTYVMRDNVFNQNVSNSSSAVTWTGLTGGVPYLFSSQTVSILGNQSTTWVNMSATPTACGVAPVADFSVNTTTVCLGESSLFTDASTNTPDEWYWMFGDLDTSTDQDPTHTYLSTGTFNVFLNASNASYGYDWENKTGYMSVVDCTAPSPITGLTGTVDSCSQITWDWTNPAEPDYSHIMVYRNNVFQYNLSDPDAQDVWSSLTASTSYTFSSRSCDTTGNCNTTWANSTESTSACPNPPVADFGVDDQTICAGDTATFTDIPAGGTPSSWFWEFGDGGDSPDENPTYQYLVPGTFDVNLKETNGDGNDWENKTNYMIVSNCTPIAAFAANDTSVCNDTAVQFTDATTNTPDNWDWYFWANETKGSDVQNPVTSFSTPGTYSIRLFASNTTYGGDFENKTDYITVTDCTPDSTAPGNVTNLNGTSTSCGVATWTWDDPVDADLLYVQFWINDVYNANVTKGTQTHSEYGLATGSYNASTRTVDITGNWNTSWTNATQLNVTACAAASGGGGGGGSTYTGDLSTMALVFGMMGGLIMGLMIVTRR